MAKAPDGLLNLRGYAAHRKERGFSGTTHRAVQLAIESGRLVRGLVRRDGKVWINPSIADQEWMNNTDAMKRPLSASPKPQPAASVPESPVYRPPPEEPRQDSLNNARAIKEAFQARLTKLLFEERQGKLVEVEKVRIEAFRVHKRARDAILALPERLSQELAAMTEPTEINNFLKIELNKALSNLSKDIYGPTQDA